MHREERRLKKKKEKRALRADVRRRENDRTRQEIDRIAAKRKQDSWENLVFFPMHELSLATIEKPVTASIELLPRLIISTHLPVGVRIALLRESSQQVLLGHTQEFLHLAKDTLNDNLSGLAETARKE